MLFFVAWFALNRFGRSPEDQREFERSFRHAFGFEDDKNTILQPCRLFHVFVQGKNAQSSMSMQTIIITDPCYVNTAEKYSEYIGRPSHSSPFQNYIKLRVGFSLYTRLTTDFFVEPSRTGDETFYRFGPRQASYELVGTHHSDSGMSCIINDDAFKIDHTGVSLNSSSDDNLKSIDKEDEGEVDWSDFVLSTLSDDNGAIDRESFPLYRWYARIPDGGSAMQVHVHYADNCTLSLEGGAKDKWVVDGMLFKSAIDRDDDHGEGGEDGCSSGSSASLPAIGSLSENDNGRKGNARSPANHQPAPKA